MPTHTGVGGEDSDEDNEPISLAARGIDRSRAPRWPADCLAAELAANCEMYDQSADDEDVIDNYVWLCNECGFELWDEDGDDPDNWAAGMR